MYYINAKNKCEKRPNNWRKYVTVDTILRRGRNNKSMAQEPIRKTIREWRTENFLTLQELAEMVGVRLQTLWNWENDRAIPAFRNIRALARALQIEPRQIVLPDPKREPISEG